MISGHLIKKKVQVVPKMKEVNGKRCQDCN